MEVPYAQLDGVDVMRESCMFYSVNSQSPGCGCDQAKVNEVAEELQKRSFERGRCVVRGVWCVVCGVWCVVCGVWCVV